MGARGTGYKRSEYALLIEILIQVWSRTLLSIFKIRLTIHGNHQLLNDRQSALLVSNHISWIDIHVINTVSPVIFVAKSDV
ncbi:MAG: lysophospholipid acyltransferase family protein, partial [Polynucleobacter victoriensis]